MFILRECNCSIIIDNCVQMPARECQLQHSWTGKLVIFALEISNSGVPNCLLHSRGWISFFFFFNYLDYSP